MIEQSKSQFGRNYRHFLCYYHPAAALKQLVPARVDQFEVCVRLFKIRARQPHAVFRVIVKSQSLARVLSRAFYFRVLFAKALPSLVAKLEDQASSFRGMPCDVHKRMRLGRAAG